MRTLLPLILAAVGIVISIFLHEAGHYLTAKWTGMKVTQFFMFMGPRLWSFRKGETEYGVGDLARLSNTLRASSCLEPRGGRTRAGHEPHHPLAQDEEAGCDVETEPGGKRLKL